MALADFAIFQSHNNGRILTDSTATRAHSRNHFPVIQINWKASATSRIATNFDDLGNHDRTGFRYTT